MENNKKYACGGSSFAHAMFVQSATSNEYMKHELEMVNRIITLKGMVFKSKWIFGNTAISINNTEVFRFNKKFVTDCRVRNPFLFRNIIIDRIEQSMIKTIVDEELCFWRKEYLQQ